MSATDQENENLKYVEIPDNEECYLENFIHDQICPRCGSDWIEIDRGAVLMDEDEVVDIAVIPHYRCLDCDQEF